MAHVLNIYAILINAIQIGGIFWSSIMDSTLNLSVVRAINIKSICKHCLGSHPFQMRWKDFQNDVLCP